MQASKQARGDGDRWTEVSMRTAFCSTDRRESKWGVGGNRNCTENCWQQLMDSESCLTPWVRILLLASSSAAASPPARTDSTDTSLTENQTMKSRFYTCIKVFLWLSLILLGFELAAYFKGWHFGASDLQLQRLYALTHPFAVKDAFDLLYSRWVLIRVEYLAPPLQFLANVCIVLFLIQSMDRLVLCLGCFWIKLRKIKPVPKQGLQILSLEMEMVYQQSIAAVCNLDWPKGRLLVQILDDSDDPTTQLLIKEEVLFTYVDCCFTDPREMGTLEAGRWFGRRSGWLVRRVLKLAVLPHIMIELRINPCAINLNENKVESKVQLTFPPVLKWGSCHVSPCLFVLALWDEALLMRAHPSIMIGIFGYIDGYRPSAGVERDSTSIRLGSMRGRSSLMCLSRFETSGVTVRLAFIWSSPRLYRVNSPLHLSRYLFVRGSRPDTARQILMSLTVVLLCTSPGILITRRAQTTLGTTLNLVLRDIKGQIGFGRDFGFGLIFILFFFTLLQFAMNPVDYELWWFVYRGSRSGSAQSKALNFTVIRALFVFNVSLVSHFTVLAVSFDECLDGASDFVFLVHT
ncbi:putative xyloglucan glycosyltransferase 12 [Sesamum angolense]|uniref:Xyloglucan glycosyltransferase 12 n=1 Tax=Sesamum angolense TaxID=2727404 RepID=A0AAE1XCA4_9LAMI|nr:putative xyloglucan glycosyltransferase 12 [Sesamum angolense]